MSFLACDFGNSVAFVHGHFYSVWGVLNIVLQVEDVVDCENSDFFDPLRTPDVKAVVPVEDTKDGGISSMHSSEPSSQVAVREWTSFKRILMQKFPVSKMVSVSSVSKTFNSFLLISIILVQI